MSRLEGRHVVAAAVLIPLIWGSEWLLASGYKSLGVALLLEGFRLLIGGILCLALGARSLRLMCGRTLGLACLAGLLVSGLPSLLSLAAASGAGFGVRSVLWSLLPLCALLGSGEAGEDGLTAPLLGVAGIVLLVSPGLGIEREALPSTVIATLSMLLQAGGLLVVQFRLRAAPVLPLSGVLQVAAALVVLPFGVLQNSGFRSAGGQWHLATGSGPWLWLLLEAVLSSCVALPLYVWLVQRCTAARAGGLLWVATSIAVVESAFVAGARLPWTSWLGFILVGAGLWRLHPTSSNR